MLPYCYDRYNSITCCASSVFPILDSELSRVMKEKDFYRSYTASEVLFELKKFRDVILNNGKVSLTEISKKQRILFENLEVHDFVGK
jgi:hypothetical protein